MHNSRRGFIASALAAMSALVMRKGASAFPVGTTDAAEPLPDLTRVQPDDTLACAATPPNIEGPYWRPSAPRRTDIRAGVSGGEQLRVSGRIISAQTCQPLRDALLDVWQADHEGHYDNDEHDHDQSEYRCRGLVPAGTDGRYSFDTIRPASYAVAGQPRPAHIHIKVSAPGHASLTTQLYFAGDPYLASDPLRAVRPELVKEVARGAGGVLMCEFDIVLAPLSRAAYLPHTPASQT